jgi:hypothetical protein
MYLFRKEVLTCLEEGTEGCLTLGKENCTVIATTTFQYKSSFYSTVLGCWARTSFSCAVGTFDVAKPVAALVRLEHSTVIPNTLEVSLCSIKQLFHIELLGNTPEVRITYTNSLIN